MITVYKVGDSLYGVFTVDESEELTALEESAAADGLTVASDAEVDAAITDCMASLGLTDADADAEQIDWIEI